MFLLFNIYKYDFVYIWFADYHAYFPVHFAKIFKKKAFIVIGGFDIARMPKLNYGIFCSKLRGYFSISAMKNATLNLSVSNYVNRKVKAITHKKNSILIYNCVNLPAQSSIQVEKENLIITVGIIETKQTFYIKGLDTFIETARQLPQYRFLIIGLKSDLVQELNINQPENLEILDKVEHTKLINFYKKAKIYCQLSRSESFGVALAEGLYYGCIPIITNEGGMKEVIGNFGVTIKRNTAIIIQKINEFILHFESYSATDNLLDKFSLKNRSNNVHQLLKHKDN